MKTRDTDTALQAFRNQGGTLRTRDLIALGVHTDTLYALRDSGRIVELGRGLYRLAEASEAEHPDLAIVAARAPNAAVCLISALSYHDITTQIPSSVHLAVPRGSYHGIKMPMPVTVYRFDPKTFHEGLETHHISKTPVKIYSAARAVVDCFKFRNKLGLDVALEALRLGRQRKHLQNRQLLKYARPLRVENPMSPYLQAIVMSRKETKSIVASVLARLRNHSKSSGAPFQQILQQYAIERFLYRISQSKHARSVILKGALLLKTFGIPSARPTMDIDMLRKGKAEQASLVGLVKDCATLKVEADGLTFLADSVVAEEITKNSEYKGTRILLDARMDNVRLRIQIDFGVDDVMVPGPRMIEYPVFLDSDTIKILAYPVESAIAEKLQAMVALGNANSRMKNFYDVWICSQHLDFNTETLLKAIDATFKNRETLVPAEEFEAFTAKFVEGHRVQWNAFVRKIGQNELTDAFGNVVEDLRIFVMPVLRSLVHSEALSKDWRAGKGWGT